MSTQSTAKGGWLDKTFRLSEKHTTVRKTHHGKERILGRFDYLPDDGLHRSR